MEKIKLMTDSVSDISYANEQQYNIQVVPIKLAVGGRTLVSRIDFDNEQFYRMLDEYNEIPSTSQITAYEFSQIFEQNYKDGYTDVINVSVNSTGSATYESSLMAAQEFYENHPEAVGKFLIHNIDSASYTGCYGFAVVEAAKMIEKGIAANEVVAYLKDWCENVTVCFAPYTLKYASKSGRIPSVAAFVGNKLNIKPIMCLNDREIVTVGKVRGERNIVPEIIKRTVAEMEERSPYCIVYGNNKLAQKEITDLMTEKLGYPPADSYQIGAAIAVNAGPNVIGLIYRKK